MQDVSMLLLGESSPLMSDSALNYTSRPRASFSERPSSKDIPHVTIIRPAKGLEPNLEECLVATYRQTYPKDKLTIYLCVASKQDPAYPLLVHLTQKFSEFDTRVLVEEDDPLLSPVHGGHPRNLGPNPKVRNMSRGYREAKGDIMWIVDCNVWLGKGVLGRMVDKLCGRGPDGRPMKPYKFIHQLPVVVDTTFSSDGAAYAQKSSKEIDFAGNALKKMQSMGGGRLEEMFMTTAHAKAYATINTVALAPCTLGKSSMFRISHLNDLTGTPKAGQNPGIDFFSDNICEDHLIGDILWTKQVADERLGRKYHKHGLVLGDLVIQPMAGMSIKDYWARRVRWIRVRKWTVLIATIVEPHIECLIVSAYGASFFTGVDWVRNALGIPNTWAAWRLVYGLNVLAWMLIDYATYSVLSCGATIEMDEHTPAFARSANKRSFGVWLLSWIARELLAFPIWAWAFLGGTTVTWRGNTFHVGYDMKVRAVKDKGL